MSDITKKVIILDNIKGCNIEQAIFILKSKQQTMAGYDVIDEANNIIYQYMSQNSNPIRREVKKKRRFFGKGEHHA